MFKIILISIPILFMVGSLLHYAYEFSNNNKIIGLFSPVNESIFEHSKLLLIPLVLFWGITFLFVKDDINYNNYFTAMVASIFVSIITMFSFYYTYVGIVGENYELMNILDLLISFLIGQLTANHIYVYGEGFPIYLSITIIIVIMLLYIYLTFKPIKIPLFYDKKNKYYGINKDRQS